MNNNQDPRRPYGNGYGPMGEPQVKRTYTPEEAGHDKHRKPVSRFSYGHRRRKKRPTVNVAAVIITLVFALIIGLCLFLIISGKNRVTDSGVKDPAKDVLAEETTEAVTTEDPLPYFTLALEERQIYYGDLILVNAYNEYFFPEEAESEIAVIAEEKNEYYGLSDYTSSTELSSIAIDAFNRMTLDFFNETGFKWLQVNSAYRDLESQTQIYADYARDYGEDYAKAYVANPGFSEHHTGLGVDVNVNIEGTVMPVVDNAECQWFRDRCQDYGFVLRYPEDKVHLTGINHESWHYRYVGVPHAQIMEDLNYCLEEYIDYLKSYTYDTICLGYLPETGVYDMTAEEFYEAESGTMIYYVGYDITAEKNETFVPKDCEYTVSGNNVDGYIITCTK